MDNTISVFKWWSMIRWFIVIVLFSIGMLNLSEDYQRFPAIIFVAVFLGIVFLNLLFQINSKYINTWITSIQVVLDIVFATMVVHLTGGLSSYFVWIYLMGVITACLMIPQLGGLFAGFIGSISLFGLIMLYQFDVLTPMVAESGNVSTRTIYILSYTALFCGVAMIAGFISDQLRLKIQVLEEKQSDLENLSKELKQTQEKLKDQEAFAKQVDELIKTSKDVSDLDHDLNTPLCIISLSLGRVKRMGLENKDETLLKSSNEITEALNRINQILQRLVPLKNCELIPNNDKGLVDE
jgi:K+-sensing histidine kinase KdpD